MGKRVRSLPALYDLDVRKRIVDGHKDYQQILAYPQPPIEKFAKTGADIDAFCRVINDGFAELIAKEKDRFPGWVAHVSLAEPDAGVAEAERAIKKLGALGVQIYTNVAGKPLDRPEYLPFWNKMNELGAPVWLHPARGAETPDYISEDRSLYEMWWTFGWSYETAMRHGAPGVREDHRHASEPEDHHPSFRRHRADARRPARAGQRRARLAHHGR
jgi:aminocarboxymuconate-semialdehyde decarboxylase